VILAGVDRYMHGLVGRKTRSVSSQLSGFIQGYLHHPARLVGPVEHLGLTLLGAAFGLLVIIVAAFLIALYPTRLVDGFMRLVPAVLRPQAADVMARVRTAWIGWMAAVGLDMLVLGGLLFLGMEIIGLNFAIGFAVFSAFMTVIPNYGSVISAIPPILAGLSQSPGKAVLVLIVYLIVNQIEGNVLLPLIMARTVDMHPSVVSIGLLVMAALFGLIGVLIAIPLLSLAIILVEALWIEPQEARAERAVPVAVTPTAGAP
jgi:predicted PurR-regulated permease PerM